MIIKFKLNGTDYNVPIEVASYIKELQDENSRSYKKVLVTPEMANEILQKLYENDETKLHNQRGKKNTAIKGYTKDMLEGKWQFCGDCIRFDTDGYCIDGQQRLNAISNSGKAQEFIFVEGLPPETKMVIDSGFKKTIEDYLKSAEKGYKLGATAIVRQVLTYLKGGKNIGNSSGDKGLTNTTVIDAYKADIEGYNDAAVYAGEVSKGTRILRKTEVGSIYYYLSYVVGIPQCDVQTFFTCLYKADIKTPNSTNFYNKTAVKLYQKDCKGATRTDLLIKSWNYFYLKKRLKITNDEWEKKFAKEKWFVDDDFVSNLKKEKENKKELAIAEAE